MRDKKVYTPPKMSSETLTVGVFGNYGNGNGNHFGWTIGRGQGNGRPNNHWWEEQ